MNTPTITLEDAEKLIGPAKEWAGNCYGIATAFVQHGLVEGHPVYGHWLGDIHPESFFGSRANMPFVHHGWVLLPDGNVCDPTRWTFTGERPFIYIGPNNGEYDEGGTQWRRHMMRPMPAYAPTDKQVDLTALPENERAALLALAGGAPAMSVPLLFWVANLPPADMAELVYPACSGIVRLGRGALIPLDHQTYVEREYGPLPDPSQTSGPRTGRAMEHPMTREKTGETPFQRWLTSYIQRSGMTNVEVGEKFGLNDSLIGHYLRGTRQPTYGSLCKIKRAIPDLDANKLFD